jgi:hypothetical protein
VQGCAGQPAEVNRKQERAGGEEASIDAAHIGRGARGRRARGIAAAWAADHHVLMLQRPAGGKKHYTVQHILCRGLTL